MKSGKALWNVLKASENKKAAIARSKKIANAFINPLPSNESDVGSVFDTRKQIKYGTNYQAARGIFAEYCDNSTIHGMKYLGEQKRPIVERFFWICVFLLSIYTCATLTMNIWNKWTFNPVIVSFAEKSTPVWEIPFPTVTVCTENKYDPHLLNFNSIWLKLLHKINITKMESFYFEAVSQICLPNPEYKGLGKRNATSSDLIGAMEKASSWFNRPCWECKWRNSETNECYKLHKVLTEEGICYSFNAIDPKDIYRDEALLDEMYFGESYDQTTLQWDLEHGYNLDADVDTFPYRVLKEGAKAGMFLVLHGYNQTFNYLCRVAVRGFKILLNTPGEVPRASEQYIPIPYNQEVLISIKPEIITTSDGLKHYDPMRRHCYLQNERELRYFKLYTQSNCKLECLSNFTMQHCGCVKFSMPRTINTPICGAFNIGCMREAEDALAYGEFRQSLKNTAKENSAAIGCNCLPACTSISYYAEISQTNSYDRNHMSEYQESSLSIFFKEAQFLSSKRSELYGTTDFLANCGGLLGLFMGVSTLSIVELVYFCTVRLLTNLRMRRRKRLELERLRNEEATAPEMNDVQAGAYE